jgi:hypothetical protein
MGTMRHHGMLVTTLNEDLAKRAHAKAVELFGDLVSEMKESKVNGYMSFAVFAIFPDGSKEGWGDSDEGDANRAKFKAWLQAPLYEDGYSPFDWVDVQYGADDHDTRIIADSDHPSEAVVVDSVMSLPE